MYHASHNMFHLTPLLSTAHYYIALSCSILHCNALYCTALHYIALSLLYCNALFYTVLQRCVSCFHDVSPDRSMHYCSLHSSPYRWSLLPMLAEQQLECYCVLSYAVLSI
jgi:hypothetical protein